MHIRSNVSHYATVLSVKEFFDQSNSPRRNGFHLDYYDSAERKLSIRQAVETLGGSVKPLGGGALEFYDEEGTLIQDPYGLVS